MLVMLMYNCDEQLHVGGIHVFQSRKLSRGPGLGTIVLNLNSMESQYSSDTHKLLMGIVWTTSRHLEIPAPHGST
ncbi:hypothetical protein MHYP_G00304800 [Metynnis hypsauchen]